MTVTVDVSSADLAPIYAEMATYYPRVIYPAVWDKLCEAREHADACTGTTTLRLSREDAALFLGWLFGCFCRREHSTDETERLSAQPLRRVAQALHAELQSPRR